MKKVLKTTFYIMGIGTFICSLLSAYDYVTGRDKHDFILALLFAISGLLLENLASRNDD